MSKKMFIFALQNGTKMYLYMARKKKHKRLYSDQKKNIWKDQKLFVYLFQLDEKKNVYGNFQQQCGYGKRDV